MKKTLLLLASIAVLSCAKKKEDNPTPTQQTQTPTPQPTLFEVTVRNDFGNLVANANVELYTLDTSSNPFGGADIVSKTIINTGKTNTNGIFLTECKENIVVKWNVNAGECEQQTSTGIIGKTNANAKNRATVIVKNTSGTLTLFNKTNDPYYIYKDGNLWYTAKAKTDTTVKLKNNTYSIRALQKDGYLVFPTNETVSKTIDCGVSETVTIN